MNQSFSTIGQVASHDFGSTANPNPRLANYVSGYVDNTENQPSRLAGFVYWLLVRRNDERLVAWNQDMNLLRNSLVIGHRWFVIKVTCRTETTIYVLSIPDGASLVVCEPRINHTV